MSDSYEKSEISHVIKKDLINNIHQMKKKNNHFQSMSRRTTVFSQNHKRMKTLSPEYFSDSVFSTQLLNQILSTTKKY